MLSLISHYQFSTKGYFCAQMNIVDQEETKITFFASKFQKEYKELNDQVRTFACDLLNLCRNSEEIECMLAQKGGATYVDTSAENYKYPRIIVALYFNQKEVGNVFSYIYISVEC